MVVFFPLSNSVDSITAVERSRNGKRYEMGAKRWPTYAGQPASQGVMFGNSISGSRDPACPMEGYTKTHIRKTRPKIGSPRCGGSRGSYLWGRKDDCPAMGDTTSSCKRRQKGTQKRLEFREGLYPRGGVGFWRAAETQASAQYFGIGQFRPVKLQHKPDHKSRKRTAGRPASRLPLGD